MNKKVLILILVLVVLSVVAFIVIMPRDREVIAPLEEETLQDVDLDFPPFPPLEIPEEFEPFDGAVEPPDDFEPIDGDMLQGDFPDFPPLPEPLE